MSQTTRLIFANQLRGLAALSVVAAHLVGAFWTDREGLGRATSTPPLTGPSPDITALVFQPWFSPGAFGVALFFLISGLVIPISLARHSTKTFLLARALRIYPTLILALILEIAAIHANASHWGLPVPFGRIVELTNILLIQDLAGTPSIDLVSWTLLAELKFYLLAALLAGPIQRGRLWPLFVTALLIAAANLAYAQGTFLSASDAPLRMASLESVLVLFMLIGVLFNYHLRGLLSPPRLAASIAGMVGLFCIAYATSETRGNFPQTTLQYLLGLGVFSLAYALRRHAVRIGVLDWLAAISYPLYLIHLIIGISTLKWLMLETDLAYLPALAISLGVTVALATLLHLGIERQSTAWGSRLAVVPSAA